MGYSVMVDAKEPWCCETPCEHRDCAAIRARVNSPCRICGHPVAPGQNYYDESEGGKTVLVHVICLYDEVVEAEEVLARGNRPDTLLPGREGAGPGGVEMDDGTKRLDALLAPLTPGKRRDFLQVILRGKEISKRVMAEMPDELESLVKDGILPGSHAWWLVMYTIAAEELGVQWTRLVEEI